MLHQLVQMLMLLEVKVESEGSTRWIEIMIDSKKTTILDHFYFVKISSSYNFCYLFDFGLDDMLKLYFER